MRKIALTGWTSLVLAMLGWLSCSDLATAQVDEFQRLTQVLQEHCWYCHGEADANADLNFEAMARPEHWLEAPDTLQAVLNAIDTGAMPPDSEAPLAEPLRLASVETLRKWLSSLESAASGQLLPLQRLNRYQYNYTVRDLFELDRNVFELPEKLMTRHDAYLANQVASQPRLPDVLQVACETLHPEPGLAGVKAYPKDLRAEHGFDNQADQLTLSPLLLDAFLRLSVSIVESPDFNAETVGIWDRFFSPLGEQADRRTEVDERVGWFLKRAFRSPIDAETQARYTAYALAQLDEGLEWSQAMKKVAAAVLSSPRFWSRSESVDSEEADWVLASRLAYFLWSSGPDETLLQLAAEQRLRDPEVLEATIERMLADPKIERFLDAFPTQWMQLENLLAVTPDPKRAPYFRLDPESPASLQMVLEPLLLFDCVFVEDRPLRELIEPTEHYQSEFLETWYRGELRPTEVDAGAVAAENQRRDALRDRWRQTIAQTQQALDEIVAPVRTRLLHEWSAQGDVPRIDLRPVAAWDFNDSLNDAIGTLHLKAEGDVVYQDGSIVLDRTYLQSPPLPMALEAKTLEVWCQLENLDQPGGGLMGIQGPKGTFDSIVLGERRTREWISGSEFFRRTDDFQGAAPETLTGEPLHLVMVYEADGTTRLYRNGEAYGQPFQKERWVFPRGVSSVLFGLRHLPAGGNRFLSVRIDRGRLYDRALTADEVAAAARGQARVVTRDDWWEALDDAQRREVRRLEEELAAAKDALDQVPVNVDLDALRRQARQAFENELRGKLRAREFRRVPVDDARYGGILTCAAMLSMTSGPDRTHPVARGVWVTEVLFNDPPEPPPNDVPPLSDASAAPNQTIRERFAAHRDHPSCAGCHSKLDPLGFALENYDLTGRWRDRYANGREVDATGELMRRHAFATPAEFRAAILSEEERFARALVKHLLRYAWGRELEVHDTSVVESIVEATEPEGYRLRTLVREVALRQSTALMRSKPAETFLPDAR